MPTHTYCSDMARSTLLSLQLYLISLAGFSNLCRLVTESESLLHPCLVNHIPSYLRRVQCRNEFHCLWLQHKPDQTSGRAGMGSHHCIRYLGFRSYIGQDATDQSELACPGKSWAVSFIRGDGLSHLSKLLLRSGQYAHGSHGTFVH